MFSNDASLADSLVLSRKNQKLETKEKQGFTKFANGHMVASKEINSQIKEKNHRNARHWKSSIPACMD